MFKVTVLAFVASAAVSNAAYNFLTIGDWGGAAISDYTSNVYKVAAEMANIAKASNPSFIINTGDNFYWCGIQNTSDFQVTTDWVDPYSDSSLQVPWYGVLGNHEYGYNVDAQMELANIYPNWVMDDRYYTRRVTVDESAGVYISFIFLDTSPCISDYRNTNQKYWDPCSTTYPTCSLDSTDDDFEGVCEFHSNILSQSCTEQYDWFATALDAVPADDWLIIVGHHPLDEVDVEDMTTLAQQHGFSLYFNGHTHSLIRYTVDKSGIYITSGAGALVSTADQFHPTTKAKADGLDADLKVGASHSYQTIFSQKVAGFTQHTFSDDYSSLTTNFISYTGSVIYSFTSDKSGNAV